jgi:hypothetical protein
MTPSSGIQSRRNPFLNHYQLHDLPYSLSPQDKSKVIKRALPTSKSLHIQLPQLLLSHLQQRLDEMRLPESDIQEDAVGFENAVDLPSNKSQKRSKNLGRQTLTINDQKEKCRVAKTGRERKKERGERKNKKTTLLTSRIYRLVSLRTWSGGDHGLPWIMASRVPLSKATSIEPDATVSSSARTSAQRHSIPFSSACRARISSRAVLEKSRHSWSV